MSIIINGTTGISGVDGTAGSPALQGNDTNTGVVFGTDTVGVVTGGVQRTTVDSSGRLLVGVGSANANGGVLQLSGGITFPGTAVAVTDVNTLDDYEEGTWTPTMLAGGSALLSSGFVAGDGPRAVYTKVGNLVTITMDGRFNGFTAATGAVTITGLPFSAWDRTSIGLCVKRELATAKVIGGYMIGTTIALTDQSSATNPAPAMTRADFYDYAGISLVFSYRV